MLGDSQELQQRSMVAGSCNWIAFDEPPTSFEAEVKIRYAAPAVKSKVTAIEASRVRVDFETPARAVTPGQATVFYDGEVVLGGGWIES